MPFVLSDDDCEIYYETIGSGPTIVFASGFMGITDIWRHQIEVLSSHFRCVAFDTRGAGRSDKPLPRIAYGVDRHAADLGTILDHLGADRIVLIGHSMGGNVACRYYRAHPERVVAIVFIGSYVAGAQIEAVGNTLGRIKAAVAMKEDRIKFYCGVGLPQHIAVESTKWPLYALEGNAGSFIQFDATAEIKNITCPCLIIHGDSDIVSPYEPCATALAAGLPDAEIELFEGVNHCPMMEAPEKTNQRIIQFLEQRIAW
jgi:pimeloyl-ACP methyl ester carboxylesterase